MGRRTSLCTTYLEDVSIATKAIAAKMRGACANPLTSPNCLASSLVRVRNRQLGPPFITQTTAGYQLFSSSSPLVINTPPSPVWGGPESFYGPLQLSCLCSQSPCRRPAPQDRRALGVGIIPPVVTRGLRSQPYRTTKVTLACRSLAFESRRGKA